MDHIKSISHVVSYRSETYCIILMLKMAFFCNIGGSKSSVENITLTEGL